jgi:hypothetical protein
MCSFAAGAFVDAGDLRKEYLVSEFDSRAMVRHPVVCLSGLLVVLLFLAGSTGVFQHTRAALRPAYPESGQLVLLARPMGVLGMETGASTGQVLTWVEYSKWFGAVAGFVLHNDGRLEVTPNFFSVLRMDPAPVFRFLGHDVQVKVIDPQRTDVPLSGAIARLKHPSDLKAAEIQWAGFTVFDAPHIISTPLEQRSRWPIYFSLVVSLAFLGAGALRAWRRLKFLAFFLVKTGLALAVVACIWLEVATAIPIPVTGGIDIGLAVPLVGLLVFSEVFVLRWSLEDQAQRCPVCCRLVSMPVSVGSRSSIILERPGVEFLCTRGHGTLVLSDLRTTTGEPWRWTPTDQSWQEVFTGERTT